MNLTNYELAKECLHTAERAETDLTATIEAMAAQTYATLALVDAVRDLGTAMSCEAIKDVVAEEVSSALLDVLKDRPTMIGGVA